MNDYKLLSVFLDYPNKDFMDNVPEFYNYINQSTSLKKDEKKIIMDYLENIENKSLIELQGEYVKIFDMNAEHSLYLTHHLFGDDKNRGPALIDLEQLYEEYGFIKTTNELPDYLPLLLEFANSLEGDESNAFLSHANKVLKVLEENLKKVSKHYSGLVSIIEKRSRLIKLGEA
ncbi:MAG: nitrate reductase molybdenum cofactor assembly chaperone [Nitrosomonadales bacterium]|jgi:nitrate reductase delta subunit|nr:nitrate reductase molybdenum cofactor assembly chaperone [Nitrosomonadales bacterium]MBT3918183.1 nitrate reductase molybdenum cofactor assembly chaperone [Nitrosomonadales bacterium]MBT4182871.1 nitrate reductase molybdenum cofactor assembly chaperone [Nitrosomonadales bacterium]MBT4571430.1 nitrate reductase molybdenum cofactor assembly chaperone [Nitrosomonadales bacterium]MBT4759717.1 nitrate reductase molybdenum cofactor assembly chaperone [Nitrosomonadales bacterium]